MIQSFWEMAWPICWISQTIFQNGQIILIFVFVKLMWCCSGRKDHFSFSSILTPLNAKEWKESVLKYKNTSTLGIKKDQREFAFSLCLVLTVHPWDSSLRACMAHACWIHGSLFAVRPSSFFLWWYMGLCLKLRGFLYWGC